jgi:hypothetical protein
MIFVLQAQEVNTETAVFGKTEMEKDLPDPDWLR